MGIILPARKVEILFYKQNADQQPYQTQLDDYFNQSYTFKSYSYFVIG